MMDKNVIKKKLFYVVVFFIYAFAIVWLCRHIWGEPQTSFGRYIHRYEKEPVEDENESECKYNIAGAYRTINNHRMYLITGWQAEKKQGTWENTLQNILLEGKECTYSVDVIKEDLAYASRVIGSKLKDERYAYRAIFPTKEMETGFYRVGLLLKDESVVWTDYGFYVGIYFEKTESGNILIDDPNLSFHGGTNTLEGWGDTACINVENNYENQELKISYDAKAVFENTYLLFYANDVMIQIDLSQELKNYECTLPLQSGTNDVWVYCIIDENASLEAGKNYYYLKNPKFTIVDKEK